MQPSLWDVPGFREEFEAALAEERAWAEDRAEAWATLDGLRLSLCGREIEAPTLRHDLRLRIVGSPFVAGGPVRAGDIAQFLWCLSPRWRVEPIGLIGRWRKLRLAEHVVRRGVERCAQEIEEFWAGVWRDAPTGKGDATPRFPPYCHTAIIVDQLSSAYGYTPAQCLALPLAVVWQLLRRRDDLRAETPPPYIAGAGVRRRALEQLNKMMAAGWRPGTN